MTSKAAVEEVIKSESPILLRVIKETGKQLVTKHDENMEKLDDQTKKFGASVFNAAKSFTSNMIKKFNAQSDTVKNDVKNVYPHTDKLIQGTFILS
jgi:gas vesicle protein